MPGTGSILKNVFDSAFSYNYVIGPFYEQALSYAEEPILRKYLEKFPPPEPGTKALDIGCGPGFITLGLAAQFPAMDIVGVDFAERMVLRAENARQKRGSTNVRFQWGDVHALPFKEAEFDLVYSTGAFKHWKIPVKGLDEIYRVLKPGGMARIVDAYQDVPQPELNKFISRLRNPFPIKGMLEPFIRDVVFGKSFSLAQVRSYVAESAFRDGTVEPMAGTPVFMMELKKE